MENINTNEYDAILNFLRGTAKDYRKRTYAQILSLSNEDLEKCHDHIQWIFPLHEESDHARIYPIISKEIVEQALNDDDITRNLLAAKNRLEEFLGIGDFNNIETQAEWCKNRNHNLLRITRIIRSLRLFGLESAAHDFYNKVVRASKYFQIDPITLSFWDKALTDDVWKTLKNNTLKEQKIWGGS